MASVYRKALSLFGWVRGLLYLWVKTKIDPAKDVARTVGIDPDKPICYVIPSRSIVDIFVLTEAARLAGLPIPKSHPSELGKEKASYIYLHKLGVFQAARKSKKAPPSPLRQLVRRADDDKELEVQIVPVSVFWGRNPGKSERSLWKMLFRDDEHAGMLQKFLIVLAQGRANQVHFGKPISLRQQVDLGKGVEDTSKMLRRVMRVHFRRKRTAFIGPSLPKRSFIVNSLMNSGKIRSAIADEAARGKQSKNKVTARARSYLEEIASAPSYPVLMFFNHFLTWVWTKIFNGVETTHMSRMKAQTEGYEVIYLPCHRSHMDYMLLGYTLFNEGMPAPHTAAGVNLNFWPVGPVLRRGGAFYLRRSFKGNRLYATVFNEYVHQLVIKGYSLKFYLEGGRSRTGRLLPARTGMLSMVVQSYLRDSRRPVAFVPVYLGYDKVMEVNSYVKELRGSAKTKESFGQFLRLPKVFKMDFGSAYIGFGNALFLDEELDRYKSDWRDDINGTDEKPAWVAPFVSQVANEVLLRINRSAVVSPIAIVSLALLSSSTKAMGEEELLFVIEKFLAALKNSPYGPDVKLPDRTPQECLKETFDIAPLKRFQSPGGNVIFFSENDAITMSYYRNNIVHLVAVPSLIASFLQHNSSINREDLINSAVQLYPFIRSEFFLPWPDRKASQICSVTLDGLIQERLLTEADGVISRPKEDDPNFICTKSLGHTLGSVFERYAIVTSMLARYSPDSRIWRDEFQGQCEKLAQRISILNGNRDPEFFDRTSFKSFIDRLKALGYVTYDVKDEKEYLQVTDKIAAFSDSSLNLLSPDIRQSIRRLSPVDQGQTLVVDQPADGVPTGG